jgi:4-diphosphocytidyl-2-C-methyl-D-erythritol kinase
MPAHAGIHEFTPARTVIHAFAPAKVNLYLHVTGKRPDGYHLLDSLAVFPMAGDFIHATPADGLSLNITGPFGGPLRAEPDNLVLRAATALAAAAGITPHAELILEKDLPVASGIGGGSADAAATLRVLAKLWRTDVPLHDLSITLGADVPVCLKSQAARMLGIGDILKPSPQLPKFWMVLVNPGIAVATAAVFRARTGAFSPPAKLPAAWPDARTMAADLSRLTNDLEAPAIALAPIIGDVLARLRANEACLLARMSGSGATCFGFFETPEAARQACLAMQRPDWWIWHGGLAEPADTGI